LVRTLTCPYNEAKLTISYTDYVADELSRVGKPYGLSWDELLCELATPSKRYYVRVNRLRASAEEAVSALKAEGYNFSVDGRLSEAIYATIDGPFPIELRDASKYVVVDRFTAESVLMGANVYAPGVKRVKGKPGDIVGIVDEKFTVIGAGRLVSLPHLGKDRRGLVVETLQSVFRAPKLRETEAFKRGYLFDQSLPSMTVSRALSPEPGDVVLDVTASPGGKITHAYELARGKALAVAIDRSLGKVEKIVKNAERLGHRILALVLDSTMLSTRAPFLRANKIIVDPPCSALGRRPRMSATVTKDMVDSAARLQRALLKSASRALLPGGYLVYSTCTLTLAENERNASWAERELGLKAEEPPIGGPVSLLSESPAVRFVPGFHESPGFFFSLFKKS